MAQITLISTKHYDNHGDISVAHTEVVTYVSDNFGCIKEAVIDIQMFILMTVEEVGDGFDMKGDWDAW